VELERRNSGFDAAPNRVLAAFLALMLLVASTISASHALHQELHSGTSDSGHFCLLCSLAKGEVGAAAVAIFVAIPLIGLFYFLPRTQSTAASAANYRLSPSRAPPRY
jgi:hypothetical protein